MGKKKKRNKAYWITESGLRNIILQNIKEQLGLSPLKLEASADNPLECYDGFWPLIKKDIDKTCISNKIETPQLDFRKIISKEQPSGTKIAKYMEGEIKVSKFSVGQVVKLKDYDSLKLANETLTYQMGEFDLKYISNAQVAIYKVHNTRQLHKDGKPVFWYEVGQWGRNIVDVPEDFLEELPEPVNIPSDNEEGEKQPENPAQETEKEMVAKFEAALNELEPYDKMAGGSFRFKNVRINALYKDCFKKTASDLYRTESLLHIAGLARSAYKNRSLDSRLSMAEISALQLDTYRKKNADYGNAFEKSMDEDGLLVAKIRIGDKIRRINSLIKNNGEGQVKDEKLEDTYLDLANYCVMTILWIRKQQSNKTTMAESNISRDHIAMEAMKVLMEKTVSNNLTLKTGSDNSLV